MKQFSALNVLLSSASARAAAAHDDDRLELYLGRDWSETLRDINADILCDGLPRDQLVALVRDRAFVLLGIETLAHCVAEVVSAVAPLAHDLADIDLAIGAVGDWMTRLSEDGVFDRMVELKANAAEVGLDDGPADSSPEAVEAWNELFDAFCQDAEAGQISFEIGGRDVLITVEADATLLIVETEPGSDDLEILVVFQHSMGDGSWDDDGDDEPEPRPDLDPARPNLVHA